MCAETRRNGYGSPVVDDAELRARIAEQVAARRAEQDRPQSPSADSPDAAGDDSDEPSAGRPGLLGRLRAGASSRSRGRHLRPTGDDTPEPRRAATTDRAPETAPEPQSSDPTVTTPAASPPAAPPTCSGGAMDADDETRSQDGDHRPSRPRPRPGDRPPNRAADRPRPGAGTTQSTESAAASRDRAPRAAGAASASTTPPAADSSGTGTSDSKEPAEQPAEPAERAPGSRRAVVKVLVRLAVTAVIAVVAVVLLRSFVVSPFYIPSGSMEPTLHGCSHCNDDRILVDKISYRFHSPNRGDIVVFHRPKGAPVSDPVLVKRVIGLPGDRLSLRGGRVYVNGKRLDESYLNTAYLRRACGRANATTSDTGRNHWTVPKDDVFVMGDARCNSFDSREFGPIPDSSIIGRAFMIIWPLGRIRFL